jgi:hypothetical protein
MVRCSKTNQLFENEAALNGFLRAERKKEFAAWRAAREEKEGDSDDDEDDEEEEAEEIAEEGGNGDGHNNDEEETQVYRSLSDSMKVDGAEQLQAVESAISSVQPTASMQDLPASNVQPTALLQDLPAACTPRQKQKKKQQKPEVKKWALRGQRISGAAESAIKGAIKLKLRPRLAEISDTLQSVESGEWHLRCGHESCDGSVDAATAKHRTGWRYYCQQQHCHRCRCQNRAATCANGRVRGSTTARSQDPALMVQHQTQGG